MSTIGRTFSGSLPEYATTCDYCGVLYHRRELTLKSNGRLACPDDAEGKVELDLDRENAAGATAVPLPRSRKR